MSTVHNTYFNGNVQSVGVKRHGEFTVGRIQKGVYEFETGEFEETISVVHGALIIDDKPYLIGLDPCVVPPGKKFKVEARGDAAYVCEYRDPNISVS